MKTGGLLVLCFVAVAWAMPSREVERAPFKLRYDPYDQAWEQFKQEYGKMYGDAGEEQNRRSVFMDNVKTIEQHNWQYFQRAKSYYLGVNQFADLTLEEYRQYNKLLKQRVGNKTIQCTKFMPPLNWALPTSVNWTAKGYVTPVKDQGYCGSCWAFSTTGSLEGQHFRQTGCLVSLSEQQLMDCSSSFGNMGCAGGWIYKAFEYINSVGGLESGNEYPYIPEPEPPTQEWRISAKFLKSAKSATEKCHFVKQKVIAEMHGCKDIPTGSEEALAQAVASVGPVSVAIDASNGDFQFYTGGVYNEPSCSTTFSDHAVLVVGYGSFKGQEYWLVKNSWSTTWGINGYIMMSRNKGNQCGIATAASFPVV